MPYWSLMWLIGVIDGWDLVASLLWNVCFLFIVCFTSLYILKLSVQCIAGKDFLLFCRLSLHLIDGLSPLDRWFPLMCKSHLLTVDWPYFLSNEKFFLFRKPVPIPISLSVLHTLSSSNFSFISNIEVFELFGVYFVWHER